MPIYFNKNSIYKDNIDNISPEEQKDDKKDSFWSKISNFTDNKKHIPVEEFIARVNKLKLDERLFRIAHEMRKRNLDRSYNYMLDLQRDFEKIPNPIETQDTRYYTFQNNVEHLLKIVIEEQEQGFSIAQDLQCDKIHEMYRIFAYSYIERNDFSKAREMIRKAIRWDPVSASVLLEASEVEYRENYDINKFLNYVKLAFDVSCTADNIATCYRKLGYYYSEQKRYSLAASLYAYSFRFADSEVAENELEYIANHAGNDFVFPTTEEVIEILHENNIPLQCSKNVEAAYIKLLQICDDRNNEEAFEIFKKDFASVLASDSQKRQILNLVMSSDK